MGCHVCGSPSFDVLLNREDVGHELEWLRQFHSSRSAGGNKDVSDFTQEEATNIVRCASCGTIYRNPQPTAEELAKRYRHDSYGIDTLQVLLDSERDFFRVKADWLAQHLPTDKEIRVLEIGSFVGAFLLAAAERDWRGTGLDIGEETVQFARSQGLHVLQCDLLDCELNPGFDAVCIWNTFDQLAEPRRILRKVRELMKPGAVLVIRVPNGNFETAALRLRRDKRRVEHVLAAQAYNNFLTFPYLCGYTPSSLSRLLTEEGFKTDVVVGDTILPLPASGRDATACREERQYKRAVCRVCDRIRNDTGEIVHPWLDVLAINTCSRQ